MATWLRIAKIVDSPEAALDLAEGTLDAEEAGVFHEQWPSYYRQAQDMIALKVQGMTERGGCAALRQKHCRSARCSTW